MHKNSKNPSSRTASMGETSEDPNSSGKIKFKKKSNID
jgi:hypothetical protein